MEHKELGKLLQLLLQESRKIYKDLPRTSVFKELEPYKDKENYYISFTSIEKIGVNPKSVYSTPLGIYTYPLKQAWSKYNIDENKKVGKAVPFAGDNPYVWLVKKKDGIKFVNSAEEYTEANLEKDIEILREHILENKKRYYRSFKKMYPDALTGTAITNSFNKWAREANKNLPVSRLWNITRNLAYRGRDGGGDNQKEDTSIITNWNTLFYKVLGYYGFADKTGVGYIHYNEPVQAVFFTKTAFDVVKFSQNRERNFENEEEARDKNWFYKNAGNIKTSDAVVKPMGLKKIKWEKGTWHSGTWENGTWVNGVWEKGNWHDGVWLNGVWESGSWHGGTWKNGTWKRGYFGKGNWKDGVWEMGEWDNNGTWENGIFKGGNWSRGHWLNGTMEFCHWHNGVWYNGTWESGIWKSGTWHDGIWHDGIWHEGLIYDPEKKGNFKEGWVWTKDGKHVKSPISPKEYWAGKK